MSRLQSVAVTVYAFLCIYLLSPSMVSAKTTLFTQRSNALSDVEGADTEVHADDAALDSVASRPAAEPAEVVNNDFTDKMSWKCANNASCLYALANGVLQSYRRGETIKLGILDVVKLPPSSKASTLNATSTGRGISTFVNFISGNAIRIPIGPMVFSVQRAEDDGNYIEVALLKKATQQGRLQGDDGGGLLGGGGGGGGMGGGGGGLFGGGGGGGGGHRGRHRKQQQDKKQFQMYIPLYLAATTFGWTMVAAKAVGLLTLKALAISKLAFIVAAMVIVKKMMEHASEKMMYQFPEHSPYMMSPYAMDYPMHPEMASGGVGAPEMYPAALQFAAAAPMQHPGHPGFEHMAAESNLHHNIAEAHNNTQVLAALNAVNMGQKVKREDSWIAKTAAGAAVRRPLAYNYLQQQHPYYRF